MTIPNKLTISTWNISQSEANPANDLWQTSVSSPPDFNSLQADTMANTILSWNSDIIILQELPSPNACCYLGNIESLYVGGSFCAKSHCGFTTILLSRKLLTIFKVYAVNIVGPTIVISICDRDPKKTTKISIIGGHLSPFKTGANNRLQEIKAALSVANTHKSSGIILGGDLNMRNDELIQVEKLGLFDAFIKLGSPKKSSVTWDSYRNKYNKNGFPFICRFDRFLFCGSNIAPIDITTEANTPISNPNHYLSDHFAVKSEWNIT